MKRRRGNIGTWEAVQNRFLTPFTGFITVIMGGAIKAIIDNRLEEKSGPPIQS